MLTTYLIEGFFLSNFLGFQRNSPAHANITKNISWFIDIQGRCYYRTTYQDFSMKRLLLFFYHIFSTRLVSNFAAHWAANWELDSRRRQSFFLVRWRVRLDSDFILAAKRRDYLFYMKDFRHSICHSASKSRECPEVYYRLDIHHSFCPHSASKSRECPEVYYRLDIHHSFCPHSASKSRECA